MTPQEQQMLDGLIGRVQSTQLAGKDNEAEARIQGALGRNSDALYILCQTVLVQGYALQQATAQLEAAKQQLAQSQQNAGSHPGFLEKIFGSSPQASPATQTGYGAPVYNVPPPQAYPGQPYPGQSYPPQGYGVPMQGGGFGGGGFLQGALQTAAGVAMGEIAVQSIEGLVHGFGREAGYSSDRALGGFGDDNSRNFGDTGTGDNFGDRLQAADGAGPGLSDDIEDRRGDGQGFLDSSSTAGDDGSGFADAGSDDSSLQDDSSSYDGGDSSSSDFSGDDGN